MCFFLLLPSHSLFPSLFISISLLGLLLQKQTLSYVIIVHILYFEFVKKTKRKMFYSSFGIFFIFFFFLLLFRETYITSSGWVAGTSNQISVVWMNRAQNISVVSTCFAPDWICVEVIRKKKQTNKKFNFFVSIEPQ